MTKPDVLFSTASGSKPVGSAAMPMTSVLPPVWAMTSRGKVPAAAAATMLDRVWRRVSMAGLLTKVTSAPTLQERRPRWKGAASGRLANRRARPLHHLIAQIGPPGLQRRGLGRADEQEPGQLVGRFESERFHHSRVECVGAGQPHAAI